MKSEAWRPQMNYKMLFLAWTLNFYNQQSLSNLSWLRIVVSSSWMVGLRSRLWTMRFFAIFISGSQGSWVPFPACITHSGLFGNGWYQRSLLSLNQGIIIHDNQVVWSAQLDICFRDNKICCGIALQLEPGRFGPGSFRLNLVGRFGLIFLSLPG